MVDAEDDIEPRFGQPGEATGAAELASLSNTTLRLDSVRRLPRRSAPRFRQSVIAGLDISRQSLDIWRHGGTVKALVQAQSLRGYSELVRDLGGNPTRLLRQAGIDPGDLNRLTVFIDFETQIDLLERSAAELHCPDFGIRLAERQDIGILGTLAVAMRHSATMTEAMRCVSKYLEAYNTGLAFTIQRGDPSGEATLEFRLRQEHADVPWAQTSEHGIGLTWRIMSLLSEGRCDLLGVWLPHPEVGTAADYRTHFDAPIAFRSDHGALVVSERDLDLPISENVVELHDAATRYLDTQLSRGTRDLSLRVRQTVMAFLGTGNCSRSDVAAGLHIHPRTMQRRLAEEGTAFEVIKEEARRDLAQRYLSHPDLSMSQITLLLGYSDQSTFGRSCRRWFGNSPRQFRARIEADFREPFSPSAIAGTPARRAAST
jgi:AraC-like DNA-binding protein